MSLLSAFYFDFALFGYFVTLLYNLFVSCLCDKVCYCLFILLFLLPEMGIKMNIQNRICLSVCPSVCVCQSVLLLMHDYSFERICMHEIWRVASLYPPDGHGNWQDSERLRRQES